MLVHELWEEPGGEYTFCLAGPMGEDARRMAGPGSKLVWTVEAASHFEAMGKYYKHMGWDTYTTDQEWDRQPYPEEWREVQSRA
ncbi:MAG: hypothetical protein ACRD1P_08095 [Thermoanaerobaculia bacterium]